MNSLLDWSAACPTAPRARARLRYGQSIPGSRRLEPLGRLQLRRCRAGDARPHPDAPVGDFPDVASRARFIESYFERLPLESDSCDLVVSSLAIHHVADKASLFRMLHKAIAPGASLRFIDGLAGASERNHRLNWGGYVGHWTSRCTDDEIRELLKHAEQHDHYRTLREHFHLLEAAGFVECDCVWRDGLWTIVTAQVPAR